MFYPHSHKPSVTPVPLPGHPYAPTCHTCQVRRHAWPYLLGLASVGDTPQQRSAAVASR